MKTILLILIAAAAMLSASCSKNDPNSTFPIKGLEMPASSADQPIASGSIVAIKGTGFTISDEIWFETVANVSESVKATGVALTAIGLSFISPSIDGQANVILKQSGKSYPLGKMYFFTTNISPTDPEQKYGTLRYVNITDAQSLFVTGRKTRATSGGGKDKFSTLYKITEDKDTQQVTFTDENGNPVTVETNYVLNLSKKFILLDLSVIHLDDVTRSHVFIVRKTDGAMFSPGYDNADGTLLNRFSYDYSYGNIYDFISSLPAMQFDKDDNVYFFTFDADNKCICKIHDDASGNIFVSRLTSSTLMPSGQYTVNGNGDVWFDYLSNAEDPAQSLCRLSSGELIKTSPYIDGSIPFSLSSYNNNFYRMNGNILYRYTPQQPEMKEEVALTCNPNDNLHNTYNVIKLSNCSVIFYQKAIGIIRNETAVKFYDMGFLLSDRSYYNSGSSIYFYDDEGYISQLDTSSISYSVIYYNRDYQIKSIRFASDNTLLFTAIDLKTGNHVLVEVDKGYDEVLYIIDGHKVTQLERIN